MGRHPGGKPDLGTCTHLACELHTADRPQRRPAAQLALAGQRRLGQAGLEQRGRRPAWRAAQHCAGGPARRCVQDDNEKLQKQVQRMQAQLDAAAAAAQAQAQAQAGSSAAPAPSQPASSSRPRPVRPSWLLPLGRGAAGTRRVLHPACTTMRCHPQASCSCQPLTGAATTAAPCSEARLQLPGRDAQGAPAVRRRRCCTCWGASAGCRAPGPWPAWTPTPRAAPPGRPAACACPSPAPGVPPRLWGRTSTCWGARPAWRTPPARAACSTSPTGPRPTRATAGTRVPPTAPVPLSLGGKLPAAGAAAMLLRSWPGGGACMQAAAWVCGTGLG